MTPAMIARVKLLAELRHVGGDVVSFASDLENDVPLMMMRTWEIPPGDMPPGLRVLTNELAAVTEANARNVAELDMVNQHLAALRAGMPAGWRLVPEVPSEAMASKGAHVNSEWLNDNAPVGEARYRDPAVAVYREMLASALTWPETVP